MKTAYKRTNWTLSSGVFRINLVNKLIAIMTV